LIGLRRRLGSSLSRKSAASACEAVARGASAGVEKAASGCDEAAQPARRLAVMQAIRVGLLIASVLSYPYFDTGLAKLSPYSG
jgi:hypothetical protein